MRKIIAEYKFLVVFAALIISCKMDWSDEIIVIENNSNQNIIVAETPDSLLTDSIVFNKIFSENFIEKNSAKGISVPNLSLKNEPDNSKSHLYFFDDDTLELYIKKDKIKGIKNKLLLKSITIQLNKVKTPVDTIYYQSWQ